MWTLAKVKRIRVCFIHLFRSSLPCALGDLLLLNAAFPLLLVAYHQPQGFCAGKPSPALDAASYQVVVTEIQHMSTVGIEASVPPVQLFRFDTPVLPACAAAATLFSPGGGGRLSAPHSPPAWKCSTSGSRRIEFNSKVGGAARTVKHVCDWVCCGCCYCCC